MKLRWLIRKYPKPTMEECEALLEQDGSICTLGQAYGKLKKTDEKVLQVQNHYINQDNGEVVDIWVDIHVFVEEVEFE